MAAKRPLPGKHSRTAANGRAEGGSAPQKTHPDGGFTFVVDRGASDLDLLDAVALLLIDLLEKEEAGDAPPPAEAAL